MAMAKEVQQRLLIFYAIYLKIKNLCIILVVFMKYEDKISFQIFVEVSHQIYEHIIERTTLLIVHT